MRYTYLEMFKCIRLLLNNVTMFRIHFTDPIQLILGTNGSGKSSIIDQLTPLPPDPNAFSKGGYKIIKIEDRGNSYVLKTTFLTSSTKHSFKKNDEELNPGGTATAQKELVYQEFRITPDIHDLLRGDEKFTEMLPTRRREWFTKLADTDYDYALGVYVRLAKRARDLSGALTMAKKNLVSETNKAISLAEEEKLQREVDEAVRQLNYLIEHRTPLDKPVSHYEDEQQHLLAEIDKLSRYLLRMKFETPYGVDPRFPAIRNEWGEMTQNHFQSLEQIDEVIQQFQHEIISKEAVIGELVTQHEEMQKTHQIISQAGDDGVKSLIEKIEQLQQKRNAVLRQRKLNIEGCHPVNCLSAFDSVYETLFQIFSELPENGNRYFTQKTLDTITESQLEKKNQLLQLQDTVNKLLAQKIHFEEHKNQGESTCPVCCHKWFPGFNSGAYEKALKQIDEKNEAIEKLTKIIAEQDDEITIIRAYGIQYRTFSQCVKSWPILSPFWDYLLGTEFPINAPRKVLTVMDQFKHDLEKEFTAMKINEEIESTAKLISSAEQIGDVKLFEINAKLHTCDISIEEHTTALHRLKKELGHYQLCRRQLSEGIDIGKKLATICSNAEAVTKDMIEMSRRETLNHCISQLQHSLAIKQESLSSAILQKGIIAELEKQVTNLTLQETAVKEMVRVLSPTEGIIAEGLLGFIRSFTNQMNNFIRKIWSYPLLIYSTGVTGADGTELDYKFPLMVQVKENIIPDVSKGSDGIREVVNLSFKMVASRYLGLQDGPLSLDEFGRALDKGHQVAAGAAIKTIMDTSGYTQLFMVSHQHGHYGAFTNAQFCVLDAKNIVTPAVYNQHVTIE